MSFDYYLPALKIRMFYTQSSSGFRAVALRKKKCDLRLPSVTKVLKPVASDMSAPHLIIHSSVSVFCSISRFAAFV